MDSWEVLRNIHRIVSPMRGTVISHYIVGLSHGEPSGHVTLKTDSLYPALLPLSHLVADGDRLSPIVIPKIGDQIDTVVFNFVDDSLYVSARANDLTESTIRRWQLYYDYIDTLTVGSTIVGVVEQKCQFGIFVNIGGPFPGLIDIGHSQFNGGIRLPKDEAHWPEEGDQIRCCVGYFRLHDQQIGLGWLP